MAIELPPWQGIGIPTVIIALLGYGSHYFIFLEDLTASQQIWFQFSLTMIWISYLIAIYQSPGSPPSDFQPKKGQWKRWCKKCARYKPERTHHCKTCKTCVLQMDHHCPWTANCVGHGNMPHFMRFLMWVNYTNGMCFYYLCGRVKHYWDNREVPIYLTSKAQLTMTIILAPLSLLILVTVGILTLRCLYHIVFTGMTQIESWEYERIEAQLESGRLYSTLRMNYQTIFGKELKSFISWSTAHNRIRDTMDESELAQLGIDDIVFPYDVNPWRNAVNACGYPWSWVLPWGRPLGDGLSFERNELIGNEDELSSLPWPPDGAHQEPNKETSDYLKIDQNFYDDNNERVLRRRGAHANRMGEEWSNEYGEKLSDFGVDVEGSDA